MNEPILLDPTIKSFEAQDFEDKLFGKVVGQERAVRRLSALYQIYLSGMASPGRPIGNLLVSWAYGIWENESCRSRR